MKDVASNESKQIRSGKALGEYVHNITDLEAKALILSETAKDIRKEADRRLSNAEKKTSDCRESLSVSNKKLDNDQAELHQLCDKQYVESKISEEANERIKLQISKEKANNEKGKLTGSETGCALGCMFVVTSVVAVIILAIVSFIINYVNSALLEPAMLVGGIITVILAVVVPIAGVVSYSKMNNSTSKPSDLREEYEEEIRREFSDAKIVMQKTVEEDLRQVESRKKAYQIAQNEESACQKQRNNAYCIAADCGNAANKIHEYVERLHSETKVIPLDYRSLDCLIEFDRIFQNDLADTMREAVKLYEERVFRGEVIRGIDKISAQLGQLNSSMEYMQRTLTSINNNVSMMSQDVFRFAQTMDSVNSTQERIFEQAKATRYAAEAVQQSQEKCEEYMKKFSE